MGWWWQCEWWCMAGRFFTLYNFFCYFFNHVNVFLLKIKRLLTWFGLQRLFPMLSLNLWEDSIHRLSSAHQRCGRRQWQGQGWRGRCDKPPLDTGKARGWERGRARKGGRKGIEKWQLFCLLWLCSIYFIHGYTFDTNIYYILFENEKLGRIQKAFAWRIQLATNNTHLRSPKESLLWANASHLRESALRRN